MAYEFSESDLQRIIKLPAWIQTLKDKYPVSVVNTADTWEEQPLPEDYIPKEVEIFYGDDVDDSDLFIRDGKLYFFSLREPVDANVIQVLIDGNWAYIQVECRVILDRLGGVILPDVVVNPEAILHSVIKSNLQNN
ncbi:hypothetical protein [Chroococcidiopsis sp. CCMEE 29]|uniref:hypothetical protein n=1 Tax=Chroococcidiopsis sp. CCMEE 29 TaxID=155894 RepID=UPI0020209006|nr:hypothetical protein [Chroococcidiopsis sp. CCMEE 29]